MATQGKKKRSAHLSHLLSFVRKEFRHMLRDRKTLLILFGMPVVQVLLFGFVLSNEVKETRIIVVDQAKDAVSQALIEKIEASSYFTVLTDSLPPTGITDAFRSGRIKAALVLPADLQRDLLHDGRNTVQILTDATDINLAQTIEGYLTAIITDFSLADGMAAPYVIVPETRMLYNPELRGAPNFVPGVMAMVLLLVCVMMTAVAIVKEKELGTMEVLLVSPMRPALVIISKAIPYLILSFINLLAILLLSVTVLDLPIRGSLPLLLAESTLFITTCLTLGILISIVTASQQAAMFASLIGLLLPTMMLSGFMFPIENMPLPLQVLSNAAPSRWYYVIVKDIMIKGAGFSSIWKETAVLSGMTLFLFAVCLKKFNIRLSER
ncbi:MAG: putative multidrug ABC transporter permease YbhR [Flavobacteriales bacterium]|nr:putative multidrug ABC transporter permease YbhR [Flavobacteriales bacterium]